MAANKAWERGRASRRSSETRERRRVLILCEDCKSSCFYFRGFKIAPERAEVLTVGMGMNTDSLVEEAIRRKAEAVELGSPYHEVWCVFDRDDFPLANYHRAFELARAQGLKIAWANQAFELWYLLHFNYHDTAISRHNYKAKLTPHCHYEKTDKEIYQKVKPHEATALRNAQRLERHWNELGEKYPERQNPSTSVHRLVEFLNDLADLGSAQ
jgi:hypothetical protein